MPLTKDQATELSNLVVLLYEMHGRSPSTAALREWVDQLSPNYGPPTIQALKAGCREPRLPGLAWVLEHAAATRKRAADLQRTEEHVRRLERERDEHERLTPEERKRRDEQASAFFTRMRSVLGYGAEGPAVGGE